ncbi:MAG: LysR family transcriptional regulator [Geminicoccaceae bacterium]
MDPYIALVKRFVEVVKIGTVQHAAAKLNMSQPALTHSIKKIEESFDCQLFERTKSGMVLTSAGERLYARSVRIIEEHSLAKLEMADVLQGRSGTLRISAGTAWGYCFLPPIIRDLQQRYTDLRVELDIALTPHALPRLRSGEVDVVFGISIDAFDEEPLFTKRSLLRFRFAAACGPSSRLARKASLKLADFRSSPLVLYQDDEQLMHRVINQIEKVIGHPLKVAVRTSSLLTAMELVMTGPYVIFLAEPFLRKFHQRGIRLLRLKEDLPSFETSIYFRDSLLRTRPFDDFMSRVLDLTASDDGAASLSSI